MVKKPIRKRSKRKTQRFKDVTKDFEAALLENVLPMIVSSGDAHVAVGIDMAAKEGNWGVSVITTNKDLSSGSLRLLLPHHFDIGGYEGKHLIRPSSVFIAKLIKGLEEAEISTAVAVDVAFGWPLEHSTFLKSWSAVPVPGTAIVSPDRSCFEYRLCDRVMMNVLKAEGRSPRIFPVGADKIASAAFEWTNLRTHLNTQGRVDVGYNRASRDGIVFFETYPSAFVRLNYPKFADYKTPGDRSNRTKSPKSTGTAKQQTRKDLFDVIKLEYNLDKANCAKCIEAAFDTSASDAFDGFLSAITAWDYLKWRRLKENPIRLSSPTTLLGYRKANREKARVKNEGWFLVRLPPTFVATVT